MIFFFFFELIINYIDYYSFSNYFAHGNDILYNNFRQVTQLKEGAQLPPPDHLMRQLVELANSENPPCANCDKRDKTTMFFCTTCGLYLKRKPVKKKL